jgi:hypothetical protein
MCENIIKKLTIIQKMSKNRKFLQFFVFQIILMLLVCENSSAIPTNTKGRVVQMDPIAIEYLTNSYDQVLVFFLQ